MIDLLPIAVASASLSVVEFRVLGAVEVLVGGHPIALGRRRERLLLGILALALNTVVSTDRLIELVWPDELPQSPRRTLGTYMSRLGGALRSADGERYGIRLLRRGDGYVLEAPVEAVDAKRFERLVAGSKCAADARRRAAMLREAFELWRGPPLADVIADEARSRACAGLDELYWSAVEERMDAMLACGRHLEVPPELADLTEQQPVRERLVGAKMIALHRAGRQSDALLAYKNLADRLRDRLGVDPGTEIRNLHLAILRNEADQARPISRADSPAKSGAAEERANAPHELPIDLESFVARDALTASAVAGLRQSGPRRAPFVLCLYGDAGIGKTTAAVRIAHTVSRSYTDGQVFLRLTDPDGSPVEARSSLERLLRTLGTAADQIPSSLEEMAAQFRSMTADRTLLLVLDDAVGVAQVRPLLPSGVRCGVIVTSRRPLLGLEDADHRQLQPLDDDASLKLLTTAAGIDADESCIQDLVRIVNRCAGRPLALRIVGARLSASGGATMKEVAAALERDTERMGALELDDRTVRASLDATARQMSSQSLLLLERLTMLDVAEFSSWVAAPLLECDAGRGDALVDELCELGVLELTRDQPWPRFTMHSLVRAYAVDRLDPMLPGSRGARRRYVRVLAALAAHADLQIQHGFLQSVGLPADPVPDLPAARVAMLLADADTWFEIEVPAICRAVAIALSERDAELAALLTLRVFGFLTIQDESTTLERILACSLDAVSDQGLYGLESRLLQARFKALAQHAARPVDLHSTAARALVRARRAREPLVEMAALMQVGYSAVLIGELADARRAYDAVVVLTENPGLEKYRGKALSGVADVCVEIGDLEHAINLYQESLSREKGLTRGRGTILLDLSQALIDSHRADEVEPAIGEARAIFTQLGDEFAQAWVDCTEADAAVSTGDLVRARRLMDSAAASFLSCDDDASMRSVRVVEARYALARGDGDLARRLLTETLEQSVACGDRQDASRCERVLAGLVTSEVT